MKTQPHRHSASPLRFAVILAVFALVMLTWACLGQDAPAPIAPADSPAIVGGGLEQTIIQLAQDHPWLVTLLALIGGLRLVIKPIMAGARFFAAKTETTKDDAALDAIERSYLYTMFLFALDWLTSIKLKPKAGTLEKTVKLLLLAGLISLAGTGCAGRTTAQVVRALSNDPASLHVRITTIYGTIEVARTAPRTNTLAHTIGENGAIEVK